MERLYELVRKYPRLGYRKISKMLAREGFRAGFTRIQQLRRREGLQVPKKPKKRRRLGDASGSCYRRQAERRNHVWAWDFLFDQTTKGSPLKVLTLVDEYTRECLCIKVARRITSKNLREVLQGLFIAHGKPAFIRSDNGPEFIARSLQKWLKEENVGPSYIEPGAPWQNGFAESFHSKIRDEFLNCELFDNVQEAQQLATQWRQFYNEVRPHASLGYRTPAEFAAMGTATARPQASPPPHPSQTVAGLS